MADVRSSWLGTVDGLLETVSEVIEVCEGTLRTLPQGEAAMRLREIVRAYVNHLADLYALRLVAASTASAQRTDEIRQRLDDAARGIDTDLQRLKAWRSAQGRSEVTPAGRGRSA